MIFDSTTRWFFLSLDGRISREAYWLGLMFLWSIFGLIITLIVNVPAMKTVAALALFPYMIFMVWAFATLLVKRAHDLGMSGFVAFLVVVPVLDLAVIVFLGAAAGDPRPNRYGPRADAPPDGGGGSSRGR